MASQGDRESFVFIARLAEQAERYDGADRIPPPLSMSPNPRSVEARSDPQIRALVIFSGADMVDAMKKVAKLDVELTVEERNLLSVGYKNVIAARRASWRILSSIEQKEETRGNEQHVKNIKEYRHKVEVELSGVCSDIMTLIDEHLIPSSSAGESSVFYYKMCATSEILCEPAEVSGD